MNKMKKRLIALLVVFTSIISFLQAGFFGQAAKADTLSADATAIKVYVDGSSTALTPTTSSDKTIYSTTEYKADGFDIGVKQVWESEAQLMSEAGKAKASMSTAVIEQKFDIVSINGTKCDTTEGQNILNDIGISITTAPTIDVSTSIVGKKITGLPLGVNKIKYKVTLTTENINYTAATKDLDGNNIPESVTADATSKKTTEYATKEITIYHGTSYATNKISSMLFKAYVGSASYFDADTDKVDSAVEKNNKLPFLYSTKAKPNSDIALKYTYDVPDSITTLKYVMTFGTAIPIDSSIKLYKNGTVATDYGISGNTITGSLTSLEQGSDLIVIKLNNTNSDVVEKAYAIEIDYNNLDSDEDYSLVDAGITKLENNDNDNVKAFIGKNFTVTEDDNGCKIYEGEINVDSRAEMISFVPELVRSSSTVAYVLTNRYRESPTTTKTLNSVLKNGMQYIDFQKSTEYDGNELDLDVYAGQNGSVTDSSKVLARYKLKVNVLTDDSFNFNLGFKSTVSQNVTLTQPGVDLEAGKIDFSKPRRTYDLCFGDLSLDLKNQPVTDPVIVSFTGKRSSNNEYLRVWLADNVNSNNLEEADASKNNNYGTNSSDVSNYLIRNKDVNVTASEVGKAQKMVVQAYYDKFEDKQVTENGVITTEKVLVGSYPAGEQYVFYIPNNFTDSNQQTSEDSNNALLKSLKINGSEVFTSGVFEYSTTAAKEDTSVKIAATADDANIDSIVASIDDSPDSYNLVSGEASQLPLNTTGTTNIKIVVTAQDGTTSKTYTVLVTNNSKSSNVNLKNVILNVGDYTFDSTADTTKVRVDQNVTSIKVTPLPEDSKANITVNGEEFLESPIIINLKGAQKNEINIEVVSEDGTASKTYTLEVNRVDVADWDNASSGSDNGNDTTEDDQFYDEYNECWVDLTKYDQWGSVNGKPAYFDKKSRQVKNAWISTGGKYYYLNNLGYRASGWKVDDADGKTYYLDPTTGEMKKGWVNLNNSWYYLELNGVMHKGWLSLNKKWYYFTPNGQMVANQSMFINDKTYNFAQDGSVY